MRLPTANSMIMKYWCDSECLLWYKLLHCVWQDLRLYRYSPGCGEDATVCNNEKLESGSTTMYLQSGKHFLECVVFRDRTDWPSVILAPSHLVDREGYSNNAIEVSKNAYHTYGIPVWNTNLSVYLYQHMGQNISVSACPPAIFAS